MLKGFPKEKGGTRELLKHCWNSKHPDLFHHVIQLLKTDGIFISPNSFMHQTAKARSFLLVFESVQLVGL